MLFAVMTCSVCAYDVIISEFMAINDSVLTDEDGNYSDWIELHNTSAAAVNLTGWHLTDDDDDLTKWTFPDTSLPAGAFLVVFASGKDRAVSGSELHTSFRLDGDGEYLALVRPDGATIAHEYAPAFPAQQSDISYGYSIALTNAVDLVVDGSSSRFHVPADGSLGTNWTLCGFDDGAWPTGAVALGFDVLGDYDDIITTDIQAEMYAVNQGCYLRIPFVVADPTASDWLLLDMKYDDGFAAYVNGNKLASANAPEPLNWDSAAVQEHPDAEAVEFQRFTIPEAAGMLVTGTNVLAIHGLNLTLNPRIDDFLILPELRGVEAILSEGPLSAPSPGMDNNTYTNSGPAGYAAAPEFDHEHGFFTNSFDVALSSPTVGASIYYTTDFSDPTTNSLIYTSPITIAATTSVRARSYEDGRYPSDVITQTYLFPDDIITQSANPPGFPSTWGTYVMFGPVGSPVPADYGMNQSIVDTYSDEIVDDLKSLPSISLVMPTDHLFNGLDGFYRDAPGHGEEWEWPVSAEMIHPDGSEGFQINCGIRIYGGYGRHFNGTPKKFMALRFKSMYGPTKLDYRMFEDSPVDEFNIILLRGVFSDAWPDSAYPPTFIRDSFARKTMGDMGQPAAHERWAHVYLNGLYWGIYDVMERHDASYAASHFGGNREDYDSIKATYTDSWGAALEVLDGDDVAWQQTQAIANAGLGSMSSYEQFRQYVDVENLADYILVNHYIANIDWGGMKNWVATRRRETGAHWKFYTWDTEYSLQGDYDRTVVNADNTPTRLYAQARANTEFRVMFGDRVHKHMFNDGVLQPGPNTARWQVLADTIEQGIVCEAARWGDNNTTRHGQRDYWPSHWSQNVGNVVDGFLHVRHESALSQLRAAGLYPNIAAPVFKIDGADQHGGAFTNGALLSISAANTIYYTLDGTDPRQYGTGAIRGTLYTGPVTLHHSVRVKARAFASGGQWSALNEAIYTSSNPPPLRVSELMYHPRDPEPGGVETNYSTSDFEFIELVNTGSETLGLAGVRFTDGITFDFNSGDVLTLDPGARVVVVRDREAFAARYDTNAVAIAGEYLREYDLPVQSLSDGGERIRLEDGLGRQLASFTYSDGRLWPQSADGAGHSLVPLVLDDQSNGRLDYWGHWRASAFIDGSPGAADPEPAATVVINEIAAHTDTGLDPPYDSDDWIELYNPLGTAVDIGGWYLSDKRDDLKRYRIPHGTVIAAGSYLLLTENLDFHTNRLDGSGFGLDKAGDSVFLSYLPGTSGDRVVDAVRFKGQENGVSLGRYPDAGTYWYALSPTPEAPNALPGLHVYISEIMYNPLRVGTNTANNTRDEYLKLHNPLGVAVDLWTDAGAWRIDGGVSYTFPPGTTLAAGESLYLVSFDPGDASELNGFLAAYGFTNGQVRLYGSYAGLLANEGERVALERPQAPDLPLDGVSWVIVDEAVYFGRAPWPVEADGAGTGIERVDALGSGNDPGNWAAPEPSLFLALHWKLDETSDTAAVDSGWYGRHGTLRDVLPGNGDGNTPPLWTPGKLGNALEFDGIDDVVRFDGGIVNGFPFTLTAWVKTSSGTGIRCAVYVGQAGQNYRYYCIGVNGGKGEIAGHVSDNPRSRLSALGATSIADGSWHHLAGVFKSPTQKLLYVDGVPEAVLTMELVYTNTVDRCSAGLCDRSSADGAWLGELDDVRVYNAELTEDGIHSLAEEVPENADADGDGLPDAWERQYFGSTNAPYGNPLDDWDLDGLNNEGEYAAGTDPTNALSVFRVLIGASNGLPVVWFTTIPASGEGYEGLDRYYDLERRTNMLEGGWTGLVPYIDILGTGSPVVFTNEAPSGRMFYRGKVRLQADGP